MAYCLRRGSANPSDETERTASRTGARLKTCASQSAKRASAREKTVEIPVTTPVAKTTGVKVEDSIVIVPILRAGMGMLDTMLRVLPYAKVGVLGMQRNEETADPVPYYAKVPQSKNDELAIVIDPMLATGGDAGDRIFGTL